MAKSDEKINCNELNTVLNKPKTYLLKDVKDKIRKVAFDVVRFDENSNIDGLWKIQNENGNDVIVALYQDENKISTASTNSWKTLSDLNGNINVFYNSQPITKISLASLSIPSNEAYLVNAYLPKKLANDENFRKSFVASLTESEKEALYEANFNGDK